MGGEVTARDVEFLQWVGRFRGVTSEQVARWFLSGSVDGVRVVNRRMAALRELGLVSSQRVLANYPAIHNLTRQGMNTAEVYGPVRSFSVGQLRHDLAVTDLLIWLKARDPGLRCMTEREVRAIDVPTTDSPQYAVKAVKGSKRHVIFPDLITISDGMAQAHEVEYTGKEGSRMRSLMLAYVLSEHLSVVTYYARPKLERRVGEALKGVTEEVGRQYPNYRVNISVQGWDWEDQSA